MVALGSLGQVSAALAQTVMTRSGGCSRYRSRWSEVWVLMSTPAWVRMSGCRNRHRRK